MDKQKLSMVDMNSLNAIAGLLRCLGQEKAAGVLLSIQTKATQLLDEIAEKEQHD